MGEPESIEWVGKWSKLESLLHYAYFALARLKTMSQWKWINL